ncbi:ATP-dependent zinc protease family protein [Litoribrevibacter albus]|uniref:Ribosomal protein S6 modification protein n=1 Tax=Litoribrevibacter albus TaxID=1473156 RepID=A0AA37SBM8_9GAMM|nr:RimK/LysX family protein [Litoribrevibacter albus]GLQ31551.1 ribosomal protein S6 modification protein [Litoribrevibacter albus]
MKNKMIVGALESCDLPELDLHQVQMRVDTGAATSSLHVDNINEFMKDGKRWVNFDIHPDVHNVDTVVNKTLLLKGKKVVKSSSADKEKRVVIKTAIQLGGQEWVIKLTLTDRSSMKNLMLLGREAMQGRLLVDPSHEFVVSDRD